MIPAPGIAWELLWERAADLHRTARLSRKARAARLSRTARTGQAGRDGLPLRRGTRTARMRGSGFGLAAPGVLAFSFSFPATAFALDGLDPYLIGVGRAGAATLLAVVSLAVLRARPPGRARLRGLLTAGLGVVFGFPVLSTLALDHGASASHAAVVIGLLPAATAAFAVIRAGERPSAAFWVAAGAGALCVSGFALLRGGGRFTAADLLLLGALLCGALGYAEGGRLARDMPGREVISWALVLTAPVSLPVTAALLLTGHPHWTVRAVAGFGYVSAVSMFAGFIVWYAGLGRAGVARAGQLQLAQPLLTLGWSALFLGERLDLLTAAAALAVLASVGATQRTRVRLRPDAGVLHVVTIDRTMRGEVSQVSQRRDPVGVASERESDRS